MELPEPEKLKMLRAVWHIRFFILSSLSLQGLLVLISSFRKRYSSGILLMFIWLFYLAADWVAAVTIGLIFRFQNNPCHPRGSEDIFAFWASFLLLHLGGPDGITSFALEDNEFWLRHFFGLVSQAIGAGYSFYLTLPGDNLLVPTTLVFIVGIIKYAERTIALYFASFDRFGKNILPEPYRGPDYEEAVAIYSTIRSVQVAEQTEITLLPSAGKIKDPKFEFHLDSESDELELFHLAYSLFQKFKGLIVGFLLSTELRESSQKLFLQIRAHVGFRLIEYELSFMYDVLHTKANVVRSRIGLIFRCITFCFMVVAFILFHFIVRKDEFGSFDVSLTYALLIGAISLDMISGIQLILSDWILIKIVQGSWKNYIPECILKRGRWSGSVSQYNMVAYCLHERWIWNCEWLDYFRGVIDKIKISIRSSTKHNIQDLKRFIFDELSKKSSEANSLSDAMEACSQRGDWALLRTSNYIKLKWSVGELQYAESLLLWHLATEICYQTLGETKPSNNNEEYDDKSREICKRLSDYIFCLLIMKPEMLAPVLSNSWHIVFQDTFAEAKSYLKKYKISEHKKVCEQMINVKTNFRTGVVKGIRSKSVWFDACILANQLQQLEEDRWKIMNSVWVELMCYGAINGRPSVHAQQPSKGGELLTFIWLLMNHLGLGSQFYEQEHQAGTKVLAVK